jgi:hypothetical protein
MDSNERLGDHLIPYNERVDRGYEQLLLLGVLDQIPVRYRVLDYRTELDLMGVFRGIELGEEVSTQGLVKKLHDASSLSHLRCHREDDWAAVMVKP